MNHKIFSSLKNFGYTEKEIQVYIAGLNSGTAPSSTISKKAKLNRVTTYGILQKLLGKGLFSTSKVKDIQHFTPIEPELLWERQKQKMEKLKNTIPLLTALSLESNMHPSVQMYEGISGVKQAYLETLHAKTDILNYANSRNIRDHWTEYDHEYVALRAQKKIFLKGIAPDDKQGQRVQKEDKDFYRETRLLPKKLFWVENEIKIFDDKVLIASFEPLSFAILIQSKTVADTQRQIFNLAWEK